MSNVPQWALDMGVEVETEETVVAEVNQELEAGIKESFAKKAKEEEYKEEKKEGLTHKAFACLKDVA